PAHGAIVIGRSPECDVWIDDPSVSRRHATLHLGQSLLVEDAGSRHGTIVRCPKTVDEEASITADAEVIALRSGERMHLSPGSVIQVGSAIIMLVQRSGPPPVAGEIVVHDPKAVALHQAADRIARTDSTVLLLGETGVGKEVIATRIHERSMRANGR